MKVDRLRRAFGLGLLIVSLGLLGWGLWPSGREVRSLSGNPNGSIPAFQLKLEWPLTLRVGDTQVARLSIQARKAENQPSGKVSAYHLMAEARLDMSAADLSPVGEVTQPWLPGQTATFFWSLRPRQAGELHGTAWLHVRFVPVNGSLEESRQLIAAPAFQVWAIDFLGLDGVMARGLGSVGVALGAVICIDQWFPWLQALVKRRWMHRR